MFLALGLGLFASECDKKIDRLNKEIEFVTAHNKISKKSGLKEALEQAKINYDKDPLFYDKKLEAKNLKEQKLKRIEKELDELKNLKDSISKDEYKAKNKALKIKKIKSKKKIDEYIGNL